ALRCGRLFGLGLYGLDVIESAEGPLVVDMNYFPSYRDVPNAAALLDDFIEDYALAPASTRLRRKMGGIGTVIRASAQCGRVPCRTVKRCGLRSSASATVRRPWCRVSSSTGPPRKASSCPA
ncbi:MAG: hypothetical protein E6J70_05130, partial [Deltaproteobacteria bacterium]